MRRENAQQEIVFGDTISNQENAFDSLEIWTDGACVPNPGRGGWGYCTKEGHRGSGGMPQTTNQVMELMAVIQALKVFDEKGKSLTIISDSMYVINGATKWMPKWKVKGWMTKGQPVKHRPLWEELDALLTRNIITFKWVKGHSGDEMNELADQIATEALCLSDLEIKKYHDFLFRKKAAKKRNAQK